MNNGYGVFGHVPDDASHGGGDSDYEDDNAAWGNGLRRRNPWKSANADGDESMLPDDGDFVGVDDDGNDDVAFGSAGSLSAEDAVVPYSQSRRPGRSVWFDDEDEINGLNEQGVRQVPIAALRRDVETSTSNAVLARARVIARKAASMLIDPTYDENRRTGYAELGAMMRGTTSPSSRYRVNLQFDLDTGEVAGGDCTCPAYGRGYGICKHMAALALMFCYEPQRFKGYHAGAVRPSRALLDYMERADKQDAQVRARRRSAVMQRFDGGGTAGRGVSSHRNRTGYGSGMGGYQGLRETVSVGQVRLTPILSFIDGTWSVEFKIGSAINSSSYVLKSIPQFVRAMTNGDHEDYGQKLAFTHTPDMLDADSRPLLRFLKSALAIRHAAEQ